MAPTREDYIDILSLFLGKNHAIPLGDHDLFAAQAIQRAVATSDFRYAEKSDHVAIAGRVRDMGRAEEAKRRYLEGGG